MSRTAPAFFVIDLNVKDREAFDRGYGSVVGAMVTKHGGTFVVGGQKAVPVEGAPPEGAVIIVRFDSMDKANAFLSDPEYPRIVPVRHQTAETRSYLVEGVAS